MESWCRAILEWVNCLDILDVHVNDLSDLKDGKFYAKLIKILSKNKSNNCDKDDEDLVFNFIRDAYPEFSGNGKVEKGTYSDIHIVSLLLMHSSHEPTLHRPMCIKLSNDTQIKIKSFLEKVLEFGSCVTKDNIDTAIKETTEVLVKTPPVTPKMRPLKDFFNSPATTVRKNYNRIMDERTREIRSLKAKLETERFEKSDLQEDLEIQRQKNLSLQQKLQEKTAEIKIIKEESMRFDTPQSSKKKKDIKTPRHRGSIKIQELTEEIEVLKSEIIHLQDENRSLVRKLASVERSCVTWEEKSRMNERNLETLLIQADLKDQEIQQLTDHNEELRTYIQEMRKQSISEQSFEMETIAMSTSSPSLNGSEVLSSVIDIQLQEAKQQSMVFESQIQDLKQRLESVQVDYDILQQSNKTLEAEVSLFQTTKQELSEIRKELKKHIETKEMLQHEKLHFQNQTAKFEKLFLSKEESLQYSEQQNETLKINLLTLEKKLATAEDALCQNNTRVQNLESVINEMKLKHEETLTAQSSRHQALEKKYMILEQEKVNLLSHVEDLNLKIISRDNSLEESCEMNRNLVSNLQDVNDKLQITQQELAKQTKKIEDLNSLITQMETEKQAFIESQFSKHQILEEKHSNLEREKLSLVKDIEGLNNVIASKDQIFKHCLNEKENLESTLHNLNEKFSTLQDSLNQERIKVENLESTINQMRLDHEETLSAKSSKYQILDEKYINLEQEQVNLLSQMENQTLKIASYETLLKEYCEKNHNLVSDVKDINDNLQSAQQELAKERERVENLDSTITQMKTDEQKFIESQLSKYQILEEKIINLEREKLSLVNDIEGLNDVILSKEQLFKHCVNEKEHLELTLQDLNKELADTQNSLGQERTTVENLESMINQIKLKHEENFTAQLSRYQDLEEKYVNSEKQNVDLLSQIENLNLRIASNENLLKESTEQNQYLVLDLQETKSKLQTTEQELAEERKRSIELESTTTQIQTDKQKFIENQFSKYQILEEKYENLEKERLCLVKNIEDLNNVISSKEQLFKNCLNEKENLQLTLEELNKEFIIIQDSLSQERTKVQDLESTIILIKQDKEDALQSQLANYQALEKIHMNGEQEKVHLETQIDRLNNLISSKEEMLEQSQQQREKFEIELRELNNNSEISKDLLCAEKTRVNDLESTLSQLKLQHEEVVQEQTMRYNELESKYLNLEREKIKLLQEIEDLNDKITANEDVLTQSQQECEKLMSELKDLNDKLQSVETSLTEERSKADNFESEITFVKRDKEEILENQTMKFQALEKKILDMEQEKVDLNLIVSKLKSDIQNFEEIKMKDNQLISEYLEQITASKEIAKEKDTLLEDMDKLHRELSDEKSKLNLLNEETKLLSSKYEEEKKVRIELETKCGLLENDNKLQTKEKKELKDTLNAIRVRNAKLEKNLDELRKKIKKLESDKLSAEEQTKVEELSATIADLQLRIQDLETEKIELSKRPTEQDFDSRVKEVHAEYEQKFEKMKQKVKITYNEQMAKVNRDQERLLQEKLEEQCHKHAEEITRYKDHVGKLSSDYWDVGEKLLIEKQEKELLAQQLQDLRMRYQKERTTAMSQLVSTAKNRTASLDRREFATTTRDEGSSIRSVPTIKEEITSRARRESIQSVHTLQGMGNAFKAEDEEGEVFNTNYLADMQAGRCTVAPDLDRLSVLQMRNAQCKPHLKSSYPAETQFQPGTFTEEEIKSGSTIDDVFNDSLSQSLLPGEKTKKRDRTHTLYKRPGPPTPSKNGGRLSLQGNELKSPNSRILRERNVERRSTATPRRLKDLFGSSSRRQDENVAGTPKGRRLSSIFRKPK